MGEESVLLGVGDDDEESGMAKRECDISAEGVSARGESGMFNMSCKSCISRSSGQTDMVPIFDSGR